MFIIQFFPPLLYQDGRMSFFICNKFVSILLLLCHCKVGRMAILDCQVVGNEYSATCTYLRKCIYDILYLLLYMRWAVSCYLFIIWYVVYMLFNPFSAKYAAVAI